MIIGNYQSGQINLINYYLRISFSEIAILTACARLAAKAAGARAYITKGSPIENLIEVVKTVLTDRKDFIKLGSFKDGAKRKDFGLTERELEVLQLLSSGATASAMGSILFLSEATIKSHLAAIYRKLEAANRAQAVSIAISEKLILK